MGAKKTFQIYQSYKEQLRHYSKKMFDPFCRRDRIALNLFDDAQRAWVRVVTTVGQLNFFRWCIYYQVIDYAVAHKDDIEKDMNNTVQKRSTKNMAKSKTKPVMGSFEVKF